MINSVTYNISKFLAIFNPLVGSFKHHILIILNFVEKVRDFIMEAD